MKSNDSRVSHRWMALGCAAWIALGGLTPRASAQSQAEEAGQLEGTGLVERESQIEGRAALPSEEYRAVVQTLLEELGAAQLVVQMMNGAVEAHIQTLRQAGTPITPETVRVIRETMAEFAREFGEDGAFLSLVTPIYAKHFTADELREILAFYRTRVGAKAVRAMPAIASETMSAGQELAAQIMPKLEARLLERLQAAQAAP